MKKTLLALSTLLVFAGCGEGADVGADPLSFAEAALHGQSAGPLTKLATFTSTSEDDRQINTTQYYANTLAPLVKDRLGKPAHLDAITSLSAFRTDYFFAASGTPPEYVTYYYNRGDLGIGREMHCIDRINTSNTYVACYVRNFAAGDNEFTFGGSTSIAFANLDAGNAFATVAMVYDNTKKVIVFLVFGPDAQGARLQPFAALDRVGILEAQAFAHTNPTNADTSVFGVPGVDFNNHVPTNCIACHGGNYNPTTFAVTGALFLPFDLAQFDFEDVPGKTRDDQETTFTHQNEVVRKVAALAGAPGSTSVVNQLDDFYYNTVFQSDPKNEVFEGNLFQDQAVLSTWGPGSQLSNAFTFVVRPTCRNCHMANAQGHTFANESQFRQFAPQAVNDICNYVMPHSLQTLRQFWFSNARIYFETYLNYTGNAAAATQLAGCSPGNVATLDPDKIQASLVGLQ